MRFRIRLALAIVVMAFLTSCTKEMRQSLSDMDTLRKALADQYKEPNPSISLVNGNVLTVTFVNSSFNELTGDARTEKAKEIALFVMTHYPRIKDISVINLQLVRQKSFLIFSSSTSELLSFETKELSGG